MRWIGPSLLRWFIFLSRLLYTIREMSSDIKLILSWINKISAKVGWGDAYKDSEKSHFGNNTSLSAVFLNLIQRLL